MQIRRGIPRRPLSFEINSRGERVACPAAAAVLKKCILLIVQPRLPTEEGGRRGRAGAGAHRPRMSSTALALRGAGAPELLAASCVPSPSNCVARSAKGSITAAAAAGAPALALLRGGGDNTGMGVGIAAGVVLALALALAPRPPPLPMPPPLPCADEPLGLRAALRPLSAAMNGFFAREGERVEVGGTCACGTCAVRCTCD